MFNKAVLVFCLQALLIQSVFSQCTSRAAVEASGIAAPCGWAGPAVSPAFAAPYGLSAPAALSPYGYDTLPGVAGRGLYAPALDFTPTSGGGLTVTSASPVPPTGISIISENAFEGALSVVGEAPFVGTTGMEGVLPSVGAGAVNHGCGNGVNAMISEGAAFAPGYSGYPAAYAPGAVAPLAAGAFAPGLAPAGYPLCGCGRIY